MMEEQVHDVRIAISKFNQPSRDGVAVVHFKAIIHLALVAITPIFLAQQQAKQNYRAFIGIGSAIGMVMEHRFLLAYGMTIRRWVLVS